MDEPIYNIQGYFSIFKLTVEWQFLDTFLWAHTYFIFFNSYNLSDSHYYGKYFSFFNSQEHSLSF